MKGINEELSKNTNELFEIYTDTEATNKFFVGFVIENDNEFFLCKAINQYGNIDGLICCLYDSIIKVQKETTYLKNLLLLHNKNHNDKIEDIKINNNESLLLQVLKHIKDKNKICTIELCNSNMNDVVGYISLVDTKASIVKLIIVDENGKRDGEAIIDINMISCITTDSLDEQKIQLLTQIS